MHAHREYALNGARAAACRMFAVGNPERAPELLARPPRDRASNTAARASRAPARNPPRASAARTPLLLTRTLVDSTDGTTRLRTRRRPPPPAAAPRCPPAAAELEILPDDHRRGAEALGSELRELLAA